MTEVMFRIWPEHGENEVIALFPYDIADYQGNCYSYMHIGQHSSADYQYVLQASRPATAEEYRDLKEELEGIGYVLKIIHRRNDKRYMDAVQALHNKEWT